MLDEALELRREDGRHYAIVWAMDRR